MGVRHGKCSKEEWAQYMRRYRAKHPGYQWAVDLKHHYGLTPEKFEEMYAKQGGVCAICGKPETMVIKGKKVRLAVDHDAETGRVRGLLCVSCNRGIGLLKHSDELLTKAMTYLHKDAN